MDTTKKNQDKKKAVAFDVPGAKYDDCKLANDLEQLMSSPDFKVFELTPGKKTDK